MKRDSENACLNSEAWQFIHIPFECSFSPFISKKDSWGFSGVKKVEVELSKKKVVVRGEAEQSRIVKALKRNGFRSEPWCSSSEMLLSAYIGRSCNFFQNDGIGPF